MDENTNHYDLESISDGVKYLQDGYIEYCEEVISNRALPNIYDGLKPVNRRILATLHKDGVLPSKNYMKCARISGNVLALHPHGDASVYAAMVLMTDFLLLRVQVHLVGYTRQTPLQQVVILKQE